MSPSSSASWAALCLVLVVSASAAAQSSLPPVGAIPPSIVEPKHHDARTARLWSRSLAHEAAGRFGESIALREEVLAAHPDDVHTRWRIARDWIALADDPAREDDERADAYRSAWRHAQHGLETDPRCAECCSIGFVASTRLATTGGLYRNLGELRTASALLERCLERPPTWRDDALNHEAARLYHAASIHQRLLPESGMMRFLFGGRGDVARAVEFAERAAEMAPGRIEYQVELGAALLCQGHRNDDRATLRRGRSKLELARHLPRDNASDAADQDRASAMLRAPETACSSARGLRME